MDKDFRVLGMKKKLYKSIDVLGMYCVCINLSP